MVSQTELDLQFRNDELETRIAKLERQLGSLWNAGLDRLAESGYVQFDGIGMRWDDTGMQVETAGAVTKALWFLNRLEADPRALTTRYGILQAAILADQADTSSVSLRLTSDPGEASLLLTGSDAVSGITLSANSPAGTASMKAASLDGSPDQVYVELTGELRLSGLLSPSQITANQDDYDPADLNSATVVRLSSDAARDITGIVSGGGRRILLVLNVGSFDIVLKDDTTSTAANRFQLNGDVTLAADEGAFLWYDATSSRWRMAGKYSAGGGGSGLSHPEVMARNVFGGPY